MILFASCCPVPFWTKRSTSLSTYWARTCRLWGRTDSITKAYHLRRWSSRLSRNATNVALFFQNRGKVWLENFLRDSVVFQDCWERKCSRKENILWLQMWLYGVFQKRAGRVRIWSMAIIVCIFDFDLNPIKKTPHKNELTFFSDHPNNQPTIASSSYVPVSAGHGYMLPSHYCLRHGRVDALWYQKTSLVHATPWTPSLGNHALSSLPWHTPSFSGPQE